MHPWRSAPPVSVSWKASARPPSSPRVAPTRPAPPRCGRLRERQRVIHTAAQEDEMFLDLSSPVQEMSLFETRRLDF